VSRARIAIRSIATLVTLPVAPLRYVSWPSRISKLPMPIAAAALPAGAGAAPGGAAVANSQLPRPLASVSSAITGSTSVNWITSNRRDRSGSNAICASTRFAVTISRGLDHGAFSNATSGSTTFGSSDTLKSTGPRTVSVRPVSALIRAASGATKRLGSMVATAIATPTSTSATSAAATPRMTSAVRRIEVF
jgi:hypothetical protein